MKKIVTVLVALLTLAIATVSYAQYPDFKGYVNDYAGVFKEDLKIKIDYELEGFYCKKLVKIFVVTVKSLQGSSAETYTTDLAKHWNIAGRNNYVILLVAPKEKKGHLEISKNLKPLISGELAKQYSEDIEPLFKSNNWNQGIPMFLCRIIKSVEDSKFVAGKKVEAQVSTRRQIKVRKVQSSIVKNDGKKIKAYSKPAGKDAGKKEEKADFWSSARIVILAFLGSALANGILLLIICKSRSKKKDENPVKEDLKEVKISRDYAPAETGSGFINKFSELVEIAANHTDSKVGCEVLVKIAEACQDAQSFRNDYVNETILFHMQTLASNLKSRALAMQINAKNQKQE